MGVREDARMVGSETMTVETEENETECESDLQRHEEWSGLESGREELLVPPNPSIAAHIL